MSKRNSRTKHARSLRQNKNKPEGLLWDLLRAKQVCGLKFRQQYPIGPFFADFACLQYRLVVEVDGASHDVTAEADLRREKYLRKAGWKVVRFSADDVEENPEAVAIGIARILGLEYQFFKRKGTGSGMLNVKSPQKRRLNSRVETDGELAGGELGDGELGDGELGDGELGDGELRDGELGDGELRDGVEEPSPERSSDPPKGG